MTMQTDEKTTINLLKVNKLSPSVINANVRWEVDASGDKLEYAWYIFKGNERIEYVPYNKSNVLDWNPSEPGKYFIKVFVKDNDGIKVSEWSSEYKILDNLKREDIKIIASDKEGPQQLGGNINMVAEVKGEDLEYAWYIYKEGERIDYIPYKKINTIEWKPVQSGSYRLKLFVRDSFGNKVSKWSTDFVIDKD